MNNRHKFRVWDEKNQKYHDYVWFVNNCETVFNDIEYCGKQYDSHKDKIYDNPQQYFPEQCIGLSAAKSYRGSNPDDLLIYEGDIVRAAGISQRLVIVWQSGGFGFMFEAKTKIQKELSHGGDWYLFTSFSEHHNLDFVLSNMEIVGNIHEVKS